MKSIIIIPARYASTRFPGKPLADIHGKSMIERVVEKASQVGDQVWVATDDDRIYKHVDNFGGNVVMTRSDHPSGTDRIAEALDLIEAKLSTSFDVVINIQGDEPFILPSQVEQLIRSFETERVDIATLANPIHEISTVEDMNQVKVIFSPLQRAIYFSRSPIPFVRGVDRSLWPEKVDFWGHIGMYGYRSDVLRKITKLAPSKLEQCESLEQLRWLENDYHIHVETTDHKGMGIDTPEDLLRALQEGEL
ncbi:3-deoxy-manno-octulosonate cytidylyltransferase [Halosquirtibacter xylanolyticus]|uniref:3-deoxy-manno-octulosonate cytidylyltransferase n=1 Tax=Halosquirtibacter xylanolyticus TaxID=3374599 RepID=UPI0037491A45|nr:3-deoxy-manno-octulosonate cytidylyltransferase [Prolixibacteraceae bacterium]